MTKDELRSRILAILNDRYPHLHITEGSPFRKLIIDPVIDALYEAAGSLDELQNILNVGVTGTLLDRCAETFLIKRRSETKATGVVRLYFYTPNSVTIEQGREFITADGKSFSATADVTITSSQMSNNLENDLYYMVVPVSGDEDTDSHTIVHMAPPYPSDFAFVDNPEAITGSASAETDEQFLERIKDSYGLRSLMTIAGLKTHLTELFPNVVEIVADDRCTRGVDVDINSSGGVRIPNYGYIDVYIRRPLMQYTHDELLTGNSFVITGGPFLWINKVVEISGGVETDEYTPDIIITSPQSRRWTSSETLKLSHSDWSAGKDIRVYYYSHNIEDIQTIINDDTSKLLGVAVNVKAAPFAKVFLDIEFSGTPSVSDVQDYVKRQINNLTCGTPLDRSDIINWCYDIGADYANVKVFNVLTFHRTIESRTINQRFTPAIYEYYVVDRIVAHKGVTA